MRPGDFWRAMIALRGLMRQRVSSVIAERWRSQHVLKRDVFSTVERGQFITATGTVDAVLRHLNDVPWWSRLIAHFLLSNERRTLEHLTQTEQSGVAPSLLFSEKSLLVRSWIDGAP